MPALGALVFAESRRANTLDHDERVALTWWYRNQNSLDGNWYMCHYSQMIKAYGYLRVSGLSQAGEDKDGFSRQREAISRYAALHGLEIVQWFEEAYRGTDLEGRPVYREMRLALLSGDVRIVIVEKLDRIARDLMISEAILADCRKNGVEMKSSNAGEEDLCSTDPTRKFIRQVLSAVAEFDRSIIVSRMQAGKRRAIAQGKRCGGRSRYGMHKQHPQEKEIISLIQELSSSGSNTSEITCTLNERGIKTRIGRKWHPMQVSRVLSNVIKNAPVPATAILRLT